MQMVGDRDMTGEVGVLWISDIDGLIIIASFVMKSRSEALL